MEQQPRQIEITINRRFEIINPNNYVKLQIKHEKLVKKKQKLMRQLLQCKTNYENKLNEIEMTEQDIIMTREIIDEIINQNY